MYVCALTERRLLVLCLRTFELNCECVLEQEQFLIIRKIFIAIWYFHLKEKCFCSWTIFINEDNVFTERTTLSWENATTKLWENFKKVLEAFLKKMSWNFLAATFRNFSLRLLGEFWDNFRKYFEFARNYRRTSFKTKSHTKLFPPNICQI